MEFWAMAMAVNDAEEVRDAIDTPLLETFESHSRRADWLATVGVMGFAFSSVTDWKSYLPSRGDLFSLPAWLQSMQEFWEANGWAPGVAAAAIGTYIAGRVFARKNIGQLRSVFADENTPTGFQIISHARLFFMVYGQLAAILLMVYYCRELVIPCVGWIALHSMYLFSNLQQWHWMQAIFADDRFTPRASHPHHRFIMQRRAAATEYLARWHNAREIVVISGAVAAILADQLELWRGVTYGNAAGYAIIISAVILNELIVGAWRWRFAGQLKAANSAQLLSDIRRGL